MAACPRWNEAVKKSVPFINVGPPLRLFVLEICMWATGGGEVEGGRVIP